MAEKKSPHFQRQSPTAIKGIQGEKTSSLPNRCSGASAHAPCGLLRDPQNAGEREVQLPNYLQIPLVEPETLAPMVGGSGVDDSFVHEQVAVHW